MEKEIITSTFVEKGLSYYLEMIREDVTAMEELQAARSGGMFRRDVVLFLTSETIGQEGKDGVGFRLLRAFLQALAGQSVVPRGIVLMNRAVHIAADGSESIGPLTVMEEKGARILVCALSAEKYGIKDRIRVGTLADMDEICGEMMSHCKVITL